MMNTLRVPKAPGSSSLCSPEPVPVSAHPGDDPSREEALVAAVGRALTHLGTAQGYFPGMGAPNTRRLIEAYLAYGKPIEFGRCL